MDKCYTLSPEAYLSPQLPVPWSSRAESRPKHQDVPLTQARRGHRGTCRRPPSSSTLNMSSSAQSCISPGRRAKTPTPKIIFRGPASSVPPLQPLTVRPAFLPDLLLACRHPPEAQHTPPPPVQWARHRPPACLAPGTGVWLAPGQRGPTASAGHLCHGGWWLGGGCLFILLSPSPSLRIQSIFAPPILHPSSLPHCLL